MNATRIVPLRRTKPHRSEAHFAISAPNRLQESDSHYSDFSRACEAAPVRTQSTRSKWRQFAQPQTKAEADRTWLWLDRFMAGLLVCCLLASAAYYFIRSGA